MTTYHTLIVACALVLSPIAPIHAQVPGQDPVLAALNTKYQADIAATNAALRSSLALAMSIPA